MLDVVTAVTGNHPADHGPGRVAARDAPPGAPGQRRPGRRLWLPALSDTGDPVRLPELIWQVRSAMASRPNHWQDVVNAVRPHIPDLWRRLPDRDKRLFVRHVARYWEVHRHRMPPATARRITELRCTGRLSGAARPGHRRVSDPGAGAAAHPGGPGTGPSPT